MRLKDDDKKLWALVTATVRAKSRSFWHKSSPPASVSDIETVKLEGLPDMVAQKPKPFPVVPFDMSDMVAQEPQFKPRAKRAQADKIEPNRARRLSRERDPIEARLDLHGLTLVQAEARLKAFITQAYLYDYRAILVITGKGFAEGGQIKRHTPEWLSSPDLSHMVAGLSQAHPRHGGTGALYVALKRRV